MSRSKELLRIAHSSILEKNDYALHQICSAHDHADAQCSHSLFYRPAHHRLHQHAMYFCVLYENKAQSFRLQLKDRA